MSNGAQQPNQPKDVATEAATQAPPSRSDWAMLLREFWRRFKGLFAFKPFFYVFVVGAFFGGFGTWATLIAQEYGKTGSQDVFVSTATFVLALSFTGFADAMLDSGFNASMRIAAFVGGVVVLVPVTGVLLDWMLSGKVAAMGLGRTACLAGPAILLWALINVGDRKFEADRWDTAAGGDPRQGLRDK